VTLKSTMITDVTSVFAQLGDFAESVTYYAEGRYVAANGFAAVVTCCDIADQVLLVETGQNDQRRMQVLGLLSALQTGILTTTGTQSNPRKGDQIAFVSGTASPALIGLWTIESSAEDNGGGVMMWLRYEKRQVLGAQSAMRV
jgi:hypothetical protein